MRLISQIFYFLIKGGNGNRKGSELQIELTPRSIFLFFFKIPEFLAHLVNLHKTS